jgi:hypothetical protein
MKNVIPCTRLSLLVILTALFCRLSAFGQGSFAGMGAVTFNTYGGGVNAPVTLWDGSGPGLSSGWNAQLVHVRSDNVIVPLSPASIFRNTSPAASYYVQQPAENVFVPGVSPGESATLRLRAWQGASYETATLRGESSDLTLSVGGVPLSGNGPPIPPPLLVGLQGFTIVPEPSIISVALLGATLLMRRRPR